MCQNDLRDMDSAVFSRAFLKNSKNNGFSESEVFIAPLNQSSYWVDVCSNERRKMQLQVGTFLIVILLLQKVAEIVAQVFPVRLFDSWDD